MATRTQEGERDALVDTERRPSTARIEGLLARLHKPAGTAPGTPYPHDWQEPGAEAWWASEGRHRYLRVAQVEAETWRRTAPTLDDAHLLLGEPRPARVVSTFYTDGLKVDPALAAHLKTLPECSAEHAAYLDRVVAEILPHTFGPAFGDELARRGLRRVTPVYWGAQYQGHMVINWQRVMRDGLAGLARFAEHWAQAHETDQGRTPALAALTSLRGLQDFIRGYASAARDAGRADGFTEERRAELLRLADACRHVAAEPPRTFHEALQLFWFVFMYDGCDNPGRFDQYLWPFLRDDLEDGRLTRPQALELLEDVWIRLNEVRGWNMALAGQTSDGRDATNDLTYLCLEVAERLRLPAPNLSVRVFHGSPARLWERAIEVVGRGMGMPAARRMRSHSRRTPAPTRSRSTGSCSGR